MVRQVEFSTDKHGLIIDKLDGVMLHNIQTLKRGRRPINQDISSAATGTPGFEYCLEFDFEDSEAARPEDTVLDMLLARPELRIQYGIPQSAANGDMIVGGTYTTSTCNSLTQEVTAKYNPDLSDSAKDGPIGMPYMGILKFPINSTVTQQQIILSYGDRTIKKLYIAQRNGTTNAELANTIIGVNQTDRLSLKLNNYPWVDNEAWLSMQADNASRFRLDAMPVGMAVMDFSERKTGGARLSDALNVLTNINGTLEILADVTTATAAQLWIVYDAVKALQASAQRPAKVVAA